MRKVTFPFVSLGNPSVKHGPACSALAVLAESVYLELEAASGLVIVARAAEWRDYDHEWYE